MKITGNHWKDSSQLLLYTIFGALIPILGGAFIYFFSNNKGLVKELLVNGELAIYSISLLASTFFYSIRFSKQKPYKKNAFMQFLLFFTYSIATISFIVIKLTSDRINLIVVYVTVSIYIISLFIYFYMNAFEFAVADIPPIPEPRKAEKNNIDKLAKNFDKLGD